ncbi:MAG TPA: hypothetical protein PLQ93_07770 [Bacteroidia bacterium]|nr:hypothetical protein [Bacteroidia bacterium]
MPVTKLCAQGPSYYDLSFEADSIRMPFQAQGKNYVFVRSKRGVDGVNTTPAADSVRKLQVLKILLVFTEQSPEDIENREEYNMERWDNLILTYPEFFQEKTIYRNICQCSPNAGGEEFKQVQGFYIYYKAPELAQAVSKKTENQVKKEEPAQVVKEESPVVKKEENKVGESGTKSAAPVAVATGAAVAASTIPETPKNTSETTQAKSEPSRAEPAEAETPAPAKTSSDATSRKKSASSKPRKAKDPKACRPAFYGYGDQDLDAFFKDNVVMTKKQKRKAKNVRMELRLQLNFDGSIRKTQIIGENETYNALVRDALKNMNNWNAAVRGGVAIKSEVRIKLVYDKKSKAFKKAELTNNPKPGPKCKCVSDDEIFGS